MKESKTQARVIRWLKSKGLYVVKTSPGAGTPIGCPDIIGLIPGGGWVALEVKTDEKSRFRPLQKETIARLNDMYYSRVVYESNWEEVKKELERII